MSGCFGRKYFFDDLLFEDFPESGKISKADFSKRVFAVEVRCCAATLPPFV
jgi:hypothetical protein